MQLSGGNINKVVRIADTVRRPRPRNARYVHSLLGHLQHRGWTGSPRFLRYDEVGREVLSYMEGEVPWQPDVPAGVRAPQSIAAVTRLVRELHDLTAGTPLAGDSEVACHNDLAPRNTVYSVTSGKYMPVGFIDWDLAAPGLRIFDLAHVAWQYAGLGRNCSDAYRAGVRCKLICESYGLADRSTLVEMVLWWQERCWQGIEAEAAAGDKSMAALRVAGVCDEVRADYHWVAEHRSEIEAVLMA